MKPLIALLSASCAVVGLGCAQFERVDFEYRTEPPLETRLTWDDGTIPEGIALAVIARPVPDDSETTVELSSTDPKVLGVSPGPDKRIWVIYGVSPGTAAVSVKVDYSWKRNILVTVAEQK
ncbi:MAG: hypothetical protein HY898_35965 [Deltaproteobacteria bacterium]|nr:hypothetical protein [Deltaproteobacteria bacterium]